MITDDDNLLLNSSVNDLINGFSFNPEAEEFTCIICSEKFTKGFIYNISGHMCEAQRAVKEHISEEHGTVFEYLIGLDKQYTDMTEQQKNMLVYFFKGYSDAQIAEDLGNVNTSTIRHYRFQFKKREKQAKTFLAIMELLKRRKGELKNESMDTITSKASLNAADQVLESCLNGQNQLVRFPKKRKEKMIILEYLLQRFEAGRKYTEKEVNEIIQEFYEDFALLRRYLIDFGFMERESDGSKYWVEGETIMEKDRKKELIEQYKQIKKYMGVYQIKNEVNGKIFIGSYSNLKSKWDTIQMRLEEGGHFNSPLQKDWKEYGAENFSFEILEQAEVNEDVIDVKRELAKMEERWVEKLQPFDGAGYNRRPRE